MSNCHRLPGFAHFESSLNSSLCGFEGLDIRFATDEVGLPPPYPGPSAGLDLSNVNGLDLTSPHYEGLNLTQQCLNLSNTNSNISREHSNSNNANSQQNSGHHQNNTNIVKQNVPPHFHQQQQQQSEMVLNLSTQMGLNLSRTAAVSGSEMTPGSYNTMYNNFDYYNTGYYDNSYNNTTAAATLCQMEEQRCSPLNLEHRSSPLNLTSVGNIHRKRKPTSGQPVPLNMGNKMVPLMNQNQENFNIQQQDFSSNNQVYDYRIPNKLTAFYNQQQEQKSNGKIVKIQLQQNQQNVASTYQQSQVYNQKPVILTPISKCNNLSNTKVQNSNMSVNNNNLGGNEQQNINDLYFSNETFIPNQDNNVTHQYSNSLNDKKNSTNNFVNKSTPSGTGKLLSQSTKSGNSSQLQENLMPFDTSSTEDFLFQDEYAELNYSYSDALNFAAEAMSDSSPSKLFESGQCQIKDKGVKEEAVNDLSTTKNNQLFSCSNCMAQFSSSSDLAIHVEKHHKITSSNSSYTCSLCKINFFEESQLLTHNKLCHENTKVKVTPKKSSLKEKEEKQPMNMTFVNLQSSENERNKIKSIDRFSKTKTKAEIEKLREDSAKEPFPFQCITCAKKFAEKPELLLHLEEHNEVKPFKCEICNLGFTHMSAKKRHEKAHSNEKPHQCQECPKAFFRKSDLTQHIKTHGKERFKFACVDCAQVFKTEKKLKGHICSAKAPPSKQLQCSLCNSILPSKMSWGVHMWKHTKDSSYILTSESDPWPNTLLSKLPKDLSQMNLWSSDLDNLQPLNMQAVPS